MGRKKLEPLLTPNEKEKQTLPTFSEKYEEDLKRKLFENDNDVDDFSAKDIILAEKFVHHKRPGEK